MNDKKILIVDDEEDIRDLLSYHLSKEHYLVLTASNGKEAIEIAKKQHPDLILMDVMMPQMDGIQACKLLRKLPEIKSFIVFLTARNDESSEIMGFESGADDYITKPIKPRLLISRVSAILRRSSNENTNEPKNTISIGALTINPESYVVHRNNTLISLPKKEFELLYLLASKPNTVFSRERILKTIWDDNVIVTQRTIDVHIRKIREKLGEEYLCTIKGVGYKFEM